MSVYNINKVRQLGKDKIKVIKDGGVPGDEVMRFTSVFYALLDGIQENRYVILYGGSSSSKTISILQYIFLYCMKHDRKRVVLSAESIPKMKRTILADMRDFVMKTFWDESRFNITEMRYTFENGTKMFFVPADEISRWKGMRQDIVYFDEVNDIPEEIYDQADIRTSYRVISSFNPTGRFWLADRFDEESTFVHHSTVLDNEFISKDIVNSLKAKAELNKNFYRVYFLGEWGQLEGVIFEEGVNWDIIEELPREYKKRRIGIDFGYSIDPTAIVDVYFDGENYIVDEVIYKKKLGNRQILDALNYRMNFDDVKVVADSSEPKTIDYIKKKGIDIVPSVKGKDSINAGINLMKEHKIYITSRSLNIITEFRNYSWATDNEGTLLSRPIDGFNHSIDAIRYSVFDMMNRKIIKFL
jgi:phage terminase large subunit